MTQNILTPEEKKYLRKVSRYLGSMGMTYGEINFQMNEDDENISYDSNYFPTQFDNNYTAEIPDGLVPILKKIIENFSDANLFGNLPNDVKYIDDQRFEISINAKDNSISLVHVFWWTGEGPSEGVEYDKIMEEWEKKGVFDNISIPDDNYLTLKYNGGGDSGYIESEFDNGEASPGEVEEWCYQQLSDNFGGWEINEGSQGEFKFYFDEKIVTLEHTYNTQDSSINTLWEEDF